MRDEGPRRLARRGQDPPAAWSRARRPIARGALSGRLAPASRVILYALRRANSCRRRRPPKLPRRERPIATRRAAADRPASARQRTSCARPAEAVTAFDQGLPDLSRGMGQALLKIASPGTPRASPMPRVACRRWCWPWSPPRCKLGIHPPAPPVSNLATDRPDGRFPHPWRERASAQGHSARSRAACSRRRCGG
jgi:hypothetical protein